MYSLSLFVLFAFCFSSIYSKNLVNLKYLHAAIVVHGGGGETLAYNCHKSAKEA